MEQYKDDCLYDMLVRNELYADMLIKEDKYYYILCCKFILQTVSNPMHIEMLGGYKLKISVPNEYTHITNQNRIRIYWGT